MRFAPEALPFVLPPLLLAAALWGFDHRVWAVAAAGVGLLVLLFFRDPVRRADAVEDMVLAPAAGVVTRVDTVEDPALGDGRFHRVVTFLSVFDVHVQNAPVSGVVLSSRLTTGRKLAAFVENVDLVNERHLTVIERAAGSATDSGDGDRIGVRQIAGLVARRVVCDLTAGDSIERGQRIGLIKFGSRVDLMVPEHYEILIQKGDRVVNGSTPLARRRPQPGGPDAG